MSHDPTRFHREDSDETFTARPLFPRWALFIIFGLGTCSLIFAFALGWVTDDGPTVESADTDTFSASAIGHAAMEEVLDMYYWTVVSRWKSHDALLFGEGLTILAEPHVMRGGDPELDAKFQETLANAGPTLLVLPKRDGLPHSFDEDGEPIAGDIAAQFFVPRYDIQHVLITAGVDARVTRTFAASEEMPWRAQVPALDVAPTLKEVQLMEASPQLEPLIATEQGVLLAKASGARAGDALYILSDPDLLANHGLNKGENARLLLEIVRHIKGSDWGFVVIDEVMHGHEAMPSLWQQLLRFPFILGTLQVLLLLGFAIWAGAMRFGPPREEEEAIAPGKAVLIENTAELLTFGGHTGYSAERYVWMVLRDTAANLNAPPTLTDQELVEWLQAEADVRGVDIRLKEVAHRTIHLSVEDKSAKPKDLLKLARKVHAFREEMLHGA